MFADLEQKITYTELNAEDDPSNFTLQEHKMKAGIDMEVQEAEETKLKKKQEIFAFRQEYLQLLEEIDEIELQKEFTRYSIQIDPFLMKEIGQFHIVLWSRLIL